MDNGEHMKCEVLTPVTVKTTDFKDVALCSLAYRERPTLQMNWLCIHLMVEDADSENGFLQNLFYKSVPSAAKLFYN
jgi:hypothetical protein